MLWCVCTLLLGIAHLAFSRLGWEQWVFLPAGLACWLDGLLARWYAGYRLGGGVLGVVCTLLLGTPLAILRLGSCTHCG